MTEQGQVLDKLRDLGLNNYESKIWLALLSKGISTAGELSEISNVPRSRTYDVLESMEKKGFIIVKIGKPIRYIAVNPNDVLENVKNKNIKDAEIQIKQMDLLKGSEIFSELNTLAKGIQFYDVDKMTNAIKGRSNIYSYINGLIRRSKTSVKFITTNLEKDFFGLRSSLRQRKDLKVEFFAASIDKKLINEVQKYGSLIKYDLNARFCIIDDTELIFFLNDNTIDDNYDAAVHVQSGLFANALTSMMKAM